MSRGHEDLRDLHGNPDGFTLDEQIADVERQLREAQHAARFFNSWTGAARDGQARANDLRRELDHLRARRRRQRAAS